MVQSLIEMLGAVRSNIKALGKREPEELVFQVVDGKAEWGPCLLPYLPCAGTNSNSKVRKGTHLTLI